MSHIVEYLIFYLQQPNECVKFNLHVAEIDKITSLLLGLSGRLARTENDIQGLPPDTTTAEKVCTRRFSNLFLN